MKNQAQIGVIGGSGVYALKSLASAREIAVKTPFGPHSGPILLGSLEGTACAFLPRHGKGHYITPTEINNRANIYALKSLGVERVVAVAAVGSLKEELKPRDFVFPDQLFDETKSRVYTFFGEGVVAHAAFDAPFCMDQGRRLLKAAQGLGIESHEGGTYVCMEGPLYSTRAESEFHRRMGYDVIGMTAAPEAKLAREAELCYSLVCLVTDYDCWKAGEEVSTELVVSHLKANSANAQRLLQKTLPLLARAPRACRCGKALENAIVTAPAAMDRRTVKKLDLLIGRYIKKR